MLPAGQTDMSRNVVFRVANPYASPAGSLYA